MEQIEIINLENVSEEEVNKYKVREAARAIVFDDNGSVALLHATKNYYYKLPGGGIENGETNEMALSRECNEEIGCKVKIDKEIGFTVEYRKKYNLKQISYCYIAKLVGEKGIPKLEQSEIDEGFETVWLPFKDAINKVRDSKPTIYEGPYMVARDTILFETAEKMINNAEN